MTRRLSSTLGAVLFSLAGCGNAYADRVVLEERTPPRPVAPESPYEVELIGADGRTMPTFEKGGRFYVLGQVGERYSIRVENPTARRVEAVVSVDGLDVIDGTSANFKNKRGYVVPPGGDLVIPGWRVSTQQVAAFRFSSVSGSYAGRKGKARNVGVIGVAIFEERGRPEVIVRERRRDRRRRLPPPPRAGAGSVESEAAPAAEAPSAADSAGAAPSPRATRRRAPSRRPLTDSDDFCCNETKSRPGLGTEFGERRHSAVGFTRFERKNASRPDALAVLRYNDTPGLRALGILVEPSPDDEEIAKRETADPFPAIRFSKPPRP